MALVFILSLIFLTNLQGWNPTAASGETAHFSQSQMKQIVTEYIDERLAEKVEKYIVEFIQLPPALTLPSNATIEIETGNPLALRGNVTFFLRVKTGENELYTNKQHRGATISVLVRTYETALVTTAMVDRHQGITAASVRPEVVETTNLPAAPIRTIFELQGQRAKGIIPAGRVMHAGLLEPIPLVHRGAPVIIVARISGVTAKAPGRALDDGGLAEVIRVQNLSSKKVLRCIVEDQNMVRVRY